VTAKYKILYKALEAIAACFPSEGHEMRHIAKSALIQFRARENSLKPPRVITTYCAEYRETEAGAAQYIQVQIDVYQHPGTNLADWMALKLTCSRAQAEKAIEWTRALRTSSTGSRASR